MKGGGGGDQIPVPSPNVCKIPVPSLNLVQIPVTKSKIPFPLIVCRLISKNVDWRRLDTHIPSPGLKKISHSSGEQSLSSSPCWHNHIETNCIICTILVRLTVSTFAAAVLVRFISAGENLRSLFMRLTFWTFCTFPRHWALCTRKYKLQI